MPNGYEASDVIKVEIEAVVEDGRLIQLFPYGETNQEHCVHGIKLRWSCDDCEEKAENSQNETCDN